MIKLSNLEICAECKSVIWYDSPTDLGRCNCIFDPSDMEYEDLES